MQDAPVAGSEESAGSEVRQRAGNRVERVALLPLLLSWHCLLPKHLLEPLPLLQIYPIHTQNRDCWGGGRVVGWLFPHIFMCLLIFVVSFGISFVVVATKCSMVQWFQ